MFLEIKEQQSIKNHHGDSINPEFAEWVVDFISSFSNNFWISVFTIGFLIIFILFISILVISKKIGSKNRL